jgi:hypothetical protein
MAGCHPAVRPLTPGRGKGSKARWRKSSQAAIHPSLVPTRPQSSAHSACPGFAAEDMPKAKARNQLFGVAKNTTAKKWNLSPASRFTHQDRRSEAMLLERDIQVMNVEVVGDAYAIALNYLRRSGAILETIAPNDRLLQIVVDLFHRGETNRLRLANKAITKFESARLA